MSRAECSELVSTFDNFALTHVREKVGTQLVLISATEKKPVCDGGCLEKNF